MKAVSNDKLHCIGEWTRLLVSKNPFLTADVNFAFIRLIDLIKGSHLQDSIPTEKALPVVITTLSDFYGIDVTSIVPEIESGCLSSDYTKACLLLLLLTMGLRSRCQAFMKSAFLLPKSLHYCVVELTRPLIEDSLISASSFCALITPSENMPSTPIGTDKLAQVTCPVGSRPLPPFGKAPGTPLHSSLPEPLSEESAYSSKVSKQPTTLRQANILCSPTHLRRSFKRLPYVFAASSTADELTSIRSPLHSLQTLIDSPSIIPKQQLVNKVEEIRHLSAQLNEIQHLYDEVLSENSRLESVYQATQLQCTENEIRLKRREAELSELRDELVCARESHVNDQIALQQLSCLRDRLHTALEQLKSMNRISDENQELHREVVALRSRLKFLESVQPKVRTQKYLEHQISHMKEALRSADEKIVALITEREQLMSVAIAEHHQQATSSHPPASSRSRSQPMPSGSPGNFSPTTAALASRTAISLSPDSSRPGLGFPLEEFRQSASSAASAEVPVSPALPDECYAPSESLASVVAADGQLRRLENELVEVRACSQSQHRAAVRQRFRAVAALALAAIRAGELKKLHSELQISRAKADSFKSLYEEKLPLLESHLIDLQARVKRSEHLMEKYRTERRVSCEEREVAEAGARQRIESLTAELHFTSMTVQDLHDEISNLRSNLHILQTSLAQSEAARQEAEIELSHEVARFEGELFLLNSNANDRVGLFADRLATISLDLQSLHMQVVPNLQSRLQDVQVLCAEHSLTVQDLHLEEEYQREQSECARSEVKERIEQLTAELHFASASCQSSNEELNHLRLQLDTAEADLAQLQTEHSELLSTFDHFKLESNLQIETLSADLTAARHALDQRAEELAGMVAAQESLSNCRSEELQAVQISFLEQQKHSVAEKNELIQQIEDGRRSIEQFKERLDEQLRANDAYRKATEDELDRLQHKMTTMSAEYEATFNEVNQQHRVSRERLSTELEQRRASEEASLRRAAQAQLLLDETKEQISRLNDQLLDSSKLTDCQQRQLIALTLEIDNLKTRTTLDETRLSDANSHVSRLQSQLTEQLARYTALDTDYQLAQNRLSDLTHQLKQLESEAGRKDTAVHQLQTELRSAQSDRGEADRRYLALREQLRQMEADWLHSQAQLAHTRAQLSEVAKLQHETRLKLLERDYSCVEVEQRLSSLMKRRTDYGSRLTRSTLTLFSTSPVESGATRDAAVSPLRELRLPPKVTSSVAASTDSVPGQGVTGSGVDRPTQTCADVAVQKCAHHVVGGLHVSSRHSVSDLQKVSNESTALVSPQKGSRRQVCSANLPEVHARRFCRLLLASDDCPIVGVLETKSVPNDSGHTLKSVGEGQVAPSSLIQPHWDIDMSMSSEVTSINSSFLTVSHNGCHTPGRHKTIRSSGLPSTSAYIPETPFPWNTSSFSDRLGKETRVDSGKEKKRQNNALESSSSGNSSTRRKVLTFFRHGKQHKRSKLSLDSARTDMYDGGCDTRSSSVAASSDALFVRPQPPPPSK